MKTIHNILLVTAFFMLGMSIGHADIYKQVDKEGKVTFSDQPSKSAKKVILPKEKIPVPPPKAPKKYDADKEMDDDEKKDQKDLKEMKSKTKSYDKKSGKKKANYKSLTITSPTNQQTFQNVSSVSVSLSVEPKLAGAHSVKLYVNGSLYKDESATSFTVETIARGAYTLRASIYDNEGKKIISSKPVKFFVHRPSVQQQS